MYSSTSPRYSLPGSRHAVSDYATGEEDNDKSSGVGLRKARRSERIQGLLKIDTTAACRDIQPADEKIGAMASHEDSSSRPDQAVGAQSDGDLEGFDLWYYSHRGQNHDTKDQRRKRASANFVQFLITQNQSLSQRLEKVDIALVLMQTRLHEKPKTSSVTGDNSAQNQHESVATDDSATEKTESDLQRERLRLARDICIAACLVVSSIVLLKPPRLLNAVICLVDQKTKSLRVEQSANFNAGQ